MPMDELDRKKSTRRTEKWFYESILARNVQGHWQRVENTCDRGTPDAHYAGMHKELAPHATEHHPVQGWLELKMAHNKVLIGHPIKLEFRPGQLAWLTSCGYHGGVCAVAAFLERPPVQKREILLVGGAHLADVLGLPYSRLLHSPYARLCSRETIGDVLPEFLYSMYCAQRNRAEHLLLAQESNSKLIQP